MKFSLFLDTSLNLTLGLLDPEKNWLDYFHLQDRKSASVIHSLLFDMLEKNKLNLENLETLFYCSGPGSYTGMRVTEGIARLFEWQGKKIRSFYHYEIPLFCGITKGEWVANAYKGEIFIFNWKGNESESKLVKTDVFVENDEVYGHDFNLVTNKMNTVNLIYDNPKLVFSALENEEKAKKLNYYRLVENEFKLKKKKK